ncbi:MAG: GNAT family protein [Actinomycetota bacterium]
MAEFVLPIHTERLVIRLLTPEDFWRHAQLMGNPAVVQFLYEEPLTEAEAYEHLQRRFGAGLPAEGEWRNYAVDVDGQLVGEVGFSLVSSQHSNAEVGYMFDPASNGNGFATEAVQVMVDLCFDLLNVHRVVGRLDARNRASAAVLERLGFQQEGLFRQNEFVKGEWTDELVYGLLEDERK